MKKYYADLQGSFALNQHSFPLKAKECYRNVFEALIHLNTWCLEAETLEVCYGYIGLPALGVAVRHCFLKQGDTILDPTIAFLPIQKEEQPYYIFASFDKDSYFESLEQEKRPDLSWMLREQDAELQRQLIEIGIAPIG